MSVHAPSFFPSCCCVLLPKQEEREDEAEKNSTLRVQDCSFPFQIATQIIKIEMIEKWKNKKKKENFRFVSPFPHPIFPLLSCLPPNRFSYFFRVRHGWVEWKWHIWGIIGLRCLCLFLSRCRSGSRPRSVSNFKKKQRKTGKLAHWQLTIIDLCPRAAETLSISRAFVRWIATHR